jgi:hypothetical protein
LGGNNPYKKMKYCIPTLKQTAIIASLFISGALMAQGLRTSGHDMVDESGNKVLLQGVGLGNWMLPEGYMWKFREGGDRPRNIEKVVQELIGADSAAVFWREFRKFYITEADIQRIAALGFNSVRPALNARLFVTEDENPVFTEEGFVLLDSLIAWCTRYRVYVIIDMHGAPGGQTGANIDDSFDDMPRLFMDTKNQDLLVTLWTKIAMRYKDEPYVAAYDLLNEPLPENTGSAAVYKHLAEPLYKRITKAIRAVDTTHMITVEGVNWANDWSIFTGPFDDNMFYQFHYYCWNTPDNLNDIGHFIEYRKKFNTPVWVGETGEQDKPIYWGTTQYFEANNIGWSFWPWKKMDTENTPYSISLPDNWDQVVAYTGKGPKPSREIAQQAFNELIENIKLANCTYFPDVVNAIFRRVPARVEAENYGHLGFNVSYAVSDTALRSPQYRPHEPVLITAFDADDTNNPGQFIKLNGKEWVTYDINSQSDQTLHGTIRINPSGSNAVVLLSLNGEQYTCSPSAAGWQEIPIAGWKFLKGVNRLRVLAAHAEVGIDYIEFR